MATDMGVDLGTATVLVYLKGKGIVLHEPSVVAIEQNSMQVLAVGESAQRMLGRTPGNIVATRPLRDGVIADFNITEIMLKHFIRKVCERRSIFKPRIVVCIPGGTTSVEQKAVIDALTRIGAREAYLIEEPRAAALGAGLDIFAPAGNMIIDIGGGTTDVAVISLGEVVVSSSIRVGGDKFDAAIIRHIKNYHNLLIGERTAEELKISIATAFPGNRSASRAIRGRDLVSGLPRSIEFTTDMITEAVEDPLSQIIVSIRQVLERTPPELAGDIISNGIFLTGGGALLDGLGQRVTKETGVPAFLADEPVSCVARGTGMTLDLLDKLTHSLISSRKVAAAN
jgi:rod shape-determining protein MreB and related proteins